jgi:CubicO group peptidase (beta-lactamase class C family)
VLAAQVGAGAPAVVAGLGRPDGPEWIEAVGWADVSGNRPAVASSQFRIGSITKTFTAATVLRLAENGQLDLDEPAGRYLPPDFVAAASEPVRGARLRHLLAHCAGVSREVPGTMWVTLQGPDQEELRRALGLVEPVAHPGARWHYSNLGYAVLGQVVRGVTGMDCRAVIETELLKPLSLGDTGWQPGPDAAVGYRLDPYSDSVHPEPVMQQEAAGVAGELWSTAEDMLLWGDALAGGAPDVLPVSVVDAMHTLTVMADTAGWSRGWGLGLILDRKGDRILSGHTGAMPGFLAALSIDRRTRTVAVAWTNVTRGVDVGELAVQALCESLPVDPREADVEPWQPGPLTPAELRGALGRWWCEAEETIFAWRGGALQAHLADYPGASLTEFEQLGPDHFVAASGRMRGEHLWVQRDTSGAVASLVWATYQYGRAPR